MNPETTNAEAGRLLPEATCSASLRQYVAQGGRCFWCQAFTLPQNLTREHLYPRRNKQRETRGGAWVLAHAHCNESRGALNLGSPRFAKWLRRVMRGNIRPFSRKHSVESTRRFLDRRQRAAESRDASPSTIAQSGARVLSTLNDQAMRPEAI